MSLFWPKARGGTENLPRADLEKYRQNVRWQHRAEEVLGRAFQWKVQQKPELSPFRWLTGKSEFVSQVPIFIIEHGAAQRRRQAGLEPQTPQRSMLNPKRRGTMLISMEEQDA